METSPFVKNDDDYSLPSTNLFNLSSSSDSPRLSSYTGSPQLMDIDSPIATSWSSQTPIKQRSPCQESPFLQFKYKKKRAILKDSSNSPNFESPVSSSSKRPSFHLSDEKGDDNSNSSDKENVKLAVQRSIDCPDLIGDFSKPYTLPVISGKHPDLKSITPQTVANVVREFADSVYILIDCRYPYEFSGGHIKGAINIYDKDDILSKLLNKNDLKSDDNKLLIFYCEFSSERAPNMFRFLRNQDRQVNETSYPFLYYPEIYLLEGGYKAFFEQFKELCEPQTYKTMLDPDFSEELTLYRNKNKFWSRRMKKGKRIRSVLKF